MPFCNHVPHFSVLAIREYVKRTVSVHWQMGQLLAYYIGQGEIANSLLRG
jgi:hypothetical protein